MRCLHGLEKDTCGFCTGIQFMPEKKQKIEQFVNMELVKKYEELKVQYRGFMDDWTEEEIMVVYMNLKDSRGTRMELTSMLKTSMELERTKGAIAWVMAHLWSKKEDLHRGKAVIEVRKKLGL